MSAVGLDAASLCLAYAAMTALCLAMARHHEALVGSDPPPRRVFALRLAGWSLAAASLAAAVAAHGWAYGLAQWTGVAGLAGLALAATLAWSARAAAVAGLACLALAPVLACM